MIIIFMVTTLECWLIIVSYFSNMLLHCKLLGLKNCFMVIILAPVEPSWNIEDSQLIRVKWIKRSNIIIWVAQM
jgi:hypothetical protein